MWKLLAKAGVLAAGVALPLSATLPASAVTLDEYGQVVEQTAIDIDPSRFIGNDQFASDQAATDQSATDQATTDGATDQATTDQGQAATDQAATDQGQAATDQPIQAPEGEGTDASTLPMPEGGQEPPVSLRLPFDRLPLLQELGGLLPIPGSGQEGGLPLGLPALGG